jgi:putative component of membrane protein insertase Oxa1/YidC/SpoIIIJ protein YidD
LYLINFLIHFSFKVSFPSYTLPNGIVISSNHRVLIFVLFTISFFQNVISGFNFAILSFQFICTKFNFRALYYMSSLKHMHLNEYSIKSCGIDRNAPLKSRATTYNSLSKLTASSIIILTEKLCSKHPA